MRSIEVKTPVALGILVYLCVPKRYVSRGIVKEVNSIISRTSVQNERKKGYVQKKWPGRAR